MTESVVVGTSKAASMLQKFLDSRPETKDPTALYTLKDNESTGLHANTYVQLSFIQASVEEEGSG